MKGIVMPLHYDDPNQAHPCEKEGCPNIVSYDDEPFCFIDSPDSGSDVPGYSYHDKHSK